MFKIFYAESDATLYEHKDTANTGLDEILEIGQRLATDGTVLKRSRSLVKFDMAEISAALTKYSIGLDKCKFVLQLFTSHAKNLPAEYTIDATIGAQPFTNGTGFENSNPIVTNGVRWAKPEASWSLDSQTGENWISGSQNIRVNNSSLYVSGSGSGGSWLYQSGSGVFNSSLFNQSFFHQPGLEKNESFSYRPTDIHMNVTDAIQLWFSGSGGNTIDNNGFLLKLSETDESSNNQSDIRFFSRETHTIYVPRLVMLFDDSTYDSTLDLVDTDSFDLHTKIKSEYKDVEVTKIRIFSRDKFPVKSATNLFPIETVKRLPETTYYAIKDASTNEYIIQFDNIYNKVSCDSTSNFIVVDMNNFMPERYYHLQFKIKDGITEQYIDDQIYFKVVR
jgi:hypothetical protein